MGKEQLRALIRVLEQQLAGENLALGAWAIHYDKQHQAFQFDKCEIGAYCEERPAVIALDGSVLDKGGPLFE